MANQLRKSNNKKKKKAINKKLQPMMVMLIGLVRENKIVAPISSLLIEYTAAPAPLFRLKRM